MLDEKLLRLLIEQSVDVLAIIQRDGQVSYVNPTVTRLLGYSPDEFVAFSAFQVVHPEDQSSARHHFSELIAKPGSSQTVVNRVQHKDGTWRWIETVSTNHLDDDSVGAIIASIRDITGGMQAVEEIRRAEEKFRGIVESATEFAIFTTDLDGHVSSWNSGARRLLGYNESEVLGKHCRIFFTPEDNARETEGEMNDARKKGSGTDERWHVRKDGSYFWGSGLMMPLRDGQGNLHGYLKVFRDVTRAKQAEDELREANRQKDEFLAILAHELRNPLAAINNAAQLLQMKTDEQSANWASEVISRQTKDLSRILRDLLDLSRIVRGKVRIEPELIDLSTVIGRAVETVRPVIEEKNHTLELAISPIDIAVVGDPARLEQVIVNLLTNAAKFTENGGQISVTAMRSEKAIVRVKDNGTGIPSELISRIFEPFTQAQQSLDRSQGGLGIGLTLARSLIEMHGGKITAASEGLGSGAEFLISLPLADVKGLSKAEPSRRLPIASTNAYRVLVVDDNADSATTLATLLSLLGYETSLAHDGLSAIELARVNSPNAMLLDIGLPGANGYEVAMQIRRNRKLEPILLVAISGYGQEEDRQRSREAGFDYHLVKPVDFDQLSRLLYDGIRPRFIVS